MGAYCIYIGFTYALLVGIFLIPVFHQWSITPHFLQLVKFSWFRQHNVYYDVNVIDEDPLLSLPAFMFIGCLLAFFLHILFHKVRNRLKLCVIICFADDKK